MVGIGSKLRAARTRWKLTLREVQERSFAVAGQWGNPAYRISASWLDRVERGNGVLSGAKLIVLAVIYGFTPDQMLALYPSSQGSLFQQFTHISRPNTTELLEEGPLEQHARAWLPDEFVTKQPPHETALLPSVEGLLPIHYRRGIIGGLDRTLEPMIRAGSIVLIDTQKRTILSRKEWNHEFDRPIYFLHTRSGYACGFCELDKSGEWLTLIPHALSYETNKRWKYRREIEVIGMVIGVFLRRLA